MPPFNHNKPGALSVALGGELEIEQVREFFPDAVAAAEQRIERYHNSGHTTLIQGMSIHDLLEDRSDEMALVGTLKK